MTSLGTHRLCAAFHSLLLWPLPCKRSAISSTSFSQTSHSRLEPRLRATDGSEPWPKKTEFYPTSKPLKQTSNYGKLKKGGIVPPLFNPKFPFLHHLFRVGFPREPKGQLKSSPNTSRFLLLFVVFFGETTRNANKHSRG